VKETGAGVFETRPAKVTCENEATNEIARSPWQPRPPGRHRLPPPRPTMPHSRDLRASVVAGRLYFFSYQSILGQVINESTPIPVPPPRLRILIPQASTPCRHPCCRPPPLPPAAAAAARRSCRLPPPPLPPRCRTLPPPPVTLSNRSPLPPLAPATPTARCRPRRRLPLLLPSAAHAARRRPCCRLPLLPPSTARATGRRLRHRTSPPLLPIAPAVARRPCCFPTPLPPAATPVAAHRP